MSLTYSKRRRGPVTLEWLRENCRLTPEGCWEWQRGLAANGYGAVRVDNHLHRTHVLAFTLSGGVRPEGCDVMHSCDNRKCCNPSHLSAGTRSDNVQDMISKGRDRSIGERNSCARLTENAVRAIRSDTRQLKPIADSYGVGIVCIHNIKQRKSWRHVA